MSYSDSEIKDSMSSRIRKELQVQFKAKRRQNSGDIHKLQKRLHPYWQELRFVDAVNSNNTEEVKRLLQQGVSPNSTDFEMRSALHIAVSRGYADIVELLLKHGADPNKRDMIQNTPLHLAACVHNFSIISMLINANADVRCLDLHGRNPFQLASSKLQLLQKDWRNGTIEMIKLREELKQVVDLLLSILMRGIQEKMEKMQPYDVDDLQMMKLSLNSGSAEDLDDQMSKLLEGIKNL